MDFTKSAVTQTGEQLRNGARIGGEGAPVVLVECRRDRRERMVRLRMEVFQEIPGGIEGI